jgi:bifunctional aspartokinase / homoserine dehydrogenase 1
MKRLGSVFAFFVFCLSTVFASEKVVNVFLIGPGLVGGELLHQIHQGFSADKPIELRVIGIANSHFMHFDAKGIALENWKGQIAQSKESMSVETFIQRMIDLRLPHTVFVDCTSSQAVADAYPTILQSNISIVTPNKKANSGSFSTYSALKTLTEQNHVRFLYDSNVGAGLPIIHAIQSMSLGGDSIVKLEAILSGTLSYLFNTFDGTVPFSQVVRKAQKQGYTEPDPREDLNGIDMARKFLILARESGLSLEMTDITVQRFLPDTCFESSSVSEFYDKLAGFDKNLTTLVKQARQNGQVLRFIGTLENGKATLSLKAVGADHPFFHLSDTNNIASITSRYHFKNPVIIKGPGAGARITAASVLSNIIQAGVEDY